MKKKLSIFILILLLFSLASCNTDSPSNDVPNIPDEPNNNIEIGKEEEKVIATKKSFKLLCVGNSFSDDMLTYTYSILNAFGVHEIVLGNLYIGGCDIETHVINASTDKPAYVYRKNTTGAFTSYNGSKMSTALNDEEWDYVTLQQASGKSGMINTYDSKVKALNNFVRNTINNENTKVGWHMTWAYAKNSNHADFVNYNNNQDEMYKKIVDCVEQKIENLEFDFIIPNGTAIQNARTSYVGDTLTADGYHLEDLGDYIAGLSMVLSITNWNVEDMKMDLVPQKFMPYFDIIVEAIYNAIEKPYEVTNSTYTKEEVVEKKPFDISMNVSYSNLSAACKLDMYLPEGNSYDTVIHFHGGGLTGGSKDDGAHRAIASEVAGNGVGFVSVNYRLYPEAKYPDFFIDAANAVAYVMNYLSENNINGKVYISGQSAGAYIAMMLCFNKAYLENVNIKVTDIDGWIIEAGQPTTHFNVLLEEGLDTQLQRIDEKAPLYYVDGSTKFKNLLLITYTNDIACREAQTLLTYHTILNYNPNAKVEMRVYEGNHCINSTTAYRGYYIHSKIILDYVNSNK